MLRSAPSVTFYHQLTATFFEKFRLSQQQNRGHDELRNFSADTIDWEYNKKRKTHKRRVLSVTVFRVDFLLNLKNKISHTLHCCAHLFRIVTED